MNSVDFTQMTDGELLNLSLAGNGYAFEHLAGRYRSMIYQLVYSYVKDPSETEDVCQEILLKILQKGHQFKHNSLFKSWLYKMTCNTSLNYLRVLNRQPVTNQEQFVLDNNKLSPAPESALEDTETQSQVNCCLEEIPQKQREALVLKMYANLKLEDIAKTVGSSLSTVKTNISIATKKFISCMERNNGDKK